jgi:hypothetical protein
VYGILSSKPFICRKCSPSIFNLTRLHSQERQNLNYIYEAVQEFKCKPKKTKLFLKTKLSEYLRLKALVSSKKTANKKIYKNEEHKNSNFEMDESDD